MFKIASAKGERALKALIASKYGFLGHRTSAPLDTIIKDGLKPSSELPSIDGALKHVFSRFNVDNTADWLAKATINEKMNDLNRKRRMLKIVNEDKPIGYTSVSKTERIRQIKEIVDIFKNNFTKENFPKALKAAKREDLGTLTSIMLKDNIQNKLNRGILPPKGYPSNSGSANVFFTRDAILKPGKQVGENGIIVSTADITRQSSNMISDKNFGEVNVDNFKRDYLLTPMHEFSGRPKNSKITYNLDNAVFIVPKKEWSVFSKNNPNVMKVREDRARKIMINQNKPMIYTDWTV